VKSGGEQGLLGLAFHPNYATNGRFFVFYTYIGNATIPAGTLVIAEFKVSSIDPNVADPTETVVLRIPHPTNTNHNGGMLAFGRDGLPVHRRWRRRLRERPAEQRTEQGRAPRKNPAHRYQSGAKSPGSVRLATRQSVRE